MRAAIGVLTEYELHRENLARTTTDTVSVISRITGNSVRTLIRTLSLLKTENEIQEALKTGALPRTQGYVFAAHLDNPNHMKIFAQVMANPVTVPELEKLLSTRPKTAKETKPATLTLTRQSKAVETWRNNIEKDAKAYTRDDLAAFHERLVALCDLVAAKMAGMEAPDAGAQAG